MREPQIITSASSDVGCLKKSLKIEEEEDDRQTNDLTVAYQ